MAQLLHVDVRDTGFPLVGKVLGVHVDHVLSGRRANHERRVSDAGRRVYVDEVPLVAVQDVVCRLEQQVV